MYSEWTELFADFERNLSGWLSRAEEPPSEPSPPANKPAALRLIEELLERLQTYLDKSEQAAEQAMVPLTADIQAICQWLEALNTSRGKLTECTVRE